MKKITLFLCCFVFTTANFYSQNNSVEPEFYKFAFINSYQFTDPETGVEELLKANRQLEFGLCFPRMSSESAYIEKINQKKL